MTVPVVILLFVILALFLLGIREAVGYLRWIAHLKRARSAYASGQEDLKLR